MENHHLCLVNGYKSPISMGHLPGGLPSSHHHLRTHVDLRLGRAPSTGGQEATARGEAQVGQVQAADWGRGGLETQAAE